MINQALIALVSTAVMIDGQRTVIQPGQPLPPLAPHDAAQLVDSGAAEDPAVTRAEDRADAHAERRAAAEFEAARETVLAAEQSTAPAPTPTPTPAPTPAPAPTAKSRAAK